MASTSKRIDRTPRELTDLVARRERALSGKRTGPGPDAAPLGRVMQLRRLGSKLREERERQGLTQAALASRIGMDEPAISRIEKGLNPNPTLDTLNRIADGLGKTIDLVLRDETKAESAIS